MRDKRKTAGNVMTHSLRRSITSGDYAPEASHFQEPPMWEIPERSPSEDTRAYRMWPAPTS